MLIFPAIDLYQGRVVRLLHGDYEKMTVYAPDPLPVALAFAAALPTETFLMRLASMTIVASFRSTSGEITCAFTMMVFCIVPSFSDTEIIPHLRPGFLLYFPPEGEWTWND